MVVTNKGTRATLGRRVLSAGTPASIYPQVFTPSLFHSFSKR